jgi:hypothetical protein
VEELHQLQQEVSARCGETPGQRQDQRHTGDDVQRSTLLYRRAMRYNRGLDRDKDGIACEKK